MTKINTIASFFLLAFLSNAASATPILSCGCEHMGSVWDGICEVNILNYGGEGEQYYFTPFGSATIPFYLDPNVSIGYYTVHPGGSGGLLVTVLFPKGFSLTTSCANGT